MSFFKKLFNKSPETSNQLPINKEGFQQTQKKDFQSFEELFELHAGLSFEKQLNFGELIGPHPWQFDMNTGTISFADKLVFPVQVIGSLSFNDSSWMWGWANTQSGIPEHLLQQSNQLNSVGEEKNIEELTNAHYPVPEGFEHRMGMIACGLFNAKSYYCANYGQGTLVVTLEADTIPPINKSDVQNVLTKFPQLIQNMDLNHRNAFINYLIDRDFRIKTGVNSVEGIYQNSSIIAEFDDIGRLTGLKGNLA